jgi:hypothetical protein
MNKYIASVRIKGSSVKTMVFADSQLHARLILQYQYGMDSLQSTPIKVNEANAIKPLSSEQARLKSMQDRVKRDQDAVKAERARQKIKAGQNTLSAINRSI